MAGVEGNVIASFIIDEEGFLTSIEILQSPSETLSEEVRRVFNSSPIWTPGEQRGNKVAVKYTLPVQFSINNEE